MAQTAPIETEIYAPHSLQLDEDLVSYIRALTRQAPGTLYFRTGAGRIFRDLLVHWPTLDDLEDQAQALCARITEAIYPLVGALFAQAVEITVTISSTPIEPPASIDALTSYVVFDVASKAERQFFLSPRNPLPETDLLRLPCGIAVTCRPLHYRYHTIKDDRQRKGHPRAGIFEWPQRLINEMLYEQPPFIAREKSILATTKSEIHHLPKKIARAESARQASLAYRPPVAPRTAPKATPALLATTSFSALPPPVRALEHRLMAHVTDKSLSADLRLGLRKVAQSLRSYYPQAMIEEAAHYETATRRLKAPLPVAQLAARLQARVQAPTEKPAALAKAAPARTPVAAPGEKAQTPVATKQASQPAARIFAPVQAPATAARSATSIPAALPLRERPAAQPAVRAPAPAQALPSVARPVSSAAASPPRESPAAHAPEAIRGRATETRAETKLSVERRAEPPARREAPKPETPHRQETGGKTQPGPERPVAAEKPIVSHAQKTGEPARARPTERMAEEKRPALSTPSQKTTQISGTAPRFREKNAAPVRQKEIPVRHIADELEIRPAGFYDRLKRPPPELLKALPQASVGKLDKTAAYKPEKRAEVPQNTRTRRLWAGLMSPAPGPVPRMPFSRKG